MQAFSVFIGFISSLPTTCTTKLEFANPRHPKQLVCVSYSCLSQNCWFHKSITNEKFISLNLTMKISHNCVYRHPLVSQRPSGVQWNKYVAAILFSSNAQQSRVWALTHHLPTKSLFIDLIQLLCLFKHCLIVFLCVLPDHFVNVNFSLHTVSVTSSQVWGVLCFSWVLKGPIIIDHQFINNHWLLLHDMCDFCSYYKYHKCSTEPTH